MIDFLCPITEYHCQQSQCASAMVIDTQNQQASSSGIPDNNKITGLSDINLDWSNTTQIIS